MMMAQEEVADIHNETSFSDFVSEQDSRLYKEGFIIPLTVEDSGISIDGAPVLYAIGDLLDGRGTRKLAVISYHKGEIGQYRIESMAHSDANGDLKPLGQEYILWVDDSQENVVREMGERLGDQSYILSHPQLRGTPMDKKTAKSIRWPWGGRVNEATVLLSGSDPESQIVRLVTINGGGYILRGEFQDRMPEEFKIPNGGYGDIQDWAYVAVVYPSVFPPNKVVEAEKNIRDFAPRAWEEFHQTELRPGQSLAKDRQNFYSRHKNDLIEVCAFRGHGDMVKVGATEGGNPNAEGRIFLIPTEEYEKGFVDEVSGRRMAAFVVDPDKYQEIPKAPAADTGVSPSS
ncbi:hypothetical protein AA14337_3034 [Acetobacter malorum DSM 14337]|uniref:DUF7007 domain-containing protein n=1 Tax=Acetobacter malorum DSM 14337 TaxID=1307910 RepID=A0ABQ0PZA6_9PROT|nr:hypothetical protein [Acetobacter malorum]GBQ85290.1 hypothetical protein AA14337_3034 [Acetobacter malorum DSM 14337]